MSEQTQTTPRAPVKATAWKSEYLRTYRREHRKAERLSPDELERCRQNPALLREIRGAQWIACPLCGLLFGKLPEHLASEHAAELMPDDEPAPSRARPLAEAFKRKFGLPKNYPLCSRAYSEMMAAKKKASGYLPPTQTRFGQERGPSPHSGVKARREWGVSLAERQAARSRVLARPSNDAWSKNASREPKVSNWEIAEPRLCGRSHEKIAADCGLTPGTVHYHLRKMGFPPGREFVLFHGEPLTRRHLPLLIEDWIAVNYPAAPSAPTFSLRPRERLTVEQTAAMLGVSLSWVRHHMRARTRVPLVGALRDGRRYLGRAQVRYLFRELQRIHREKLLSSARREITQTLGVNPHWIIHRLRTKHESWPLSAKMGGKILLLWNGLKDKWHTHSATARGGRPRKLLPSEQAALPVRYQRLRLDLKALAKCLKVENTKHFRRVRQWICDQAKLGRMRTLLLWVDFFAWIDKHGEEWGFLSGHWVPSDLAIEFLASDYTVGATTVRDLVR